MLLDAHALIHRAFHALPNLTNAKGESMGAVYGFATILLRILAELKPDYIAAAFDMAGPTFRHVAYERYKAQRPKADDTLVSQFSRVRQLCEAFGIPVLEKAGYEADDVIGTVAANLTKNDKALKIIIVTGDLDTLQLVNPQVSVYTMRKGVTDTVTYTEKSVRERYGLRPSQLTDFKGLRGDPSDNIPGVKGIGEKTACELLGKFGSIEKLYASLKKANISGAIREKLESQKEEALFSKTLATINLEVPVTLSLSRAIWRGAKDNKKVGALLREFGFTSLLRRLGYLVEEAGVSPSFVTPGGETSPPIVEIPRTADFSDEPKLGFFFENDVLYLATSRHLYRVPDGLIGQTSMKRVLEYKRERVFFDEKEILKRCDSLLGQPADFDILIAIYLLRAGERSYTIERAAREAGIPASGQTAYEKSFAIAAALEKRLKERALWDVFRQIEMPLVPILAEIELRGMRINRAYLKSLSKKTQKILSSLEEEIHQLAGKIFNINSPRQVSEVLFETLKLNVHGIRKTAGGAVSTDAGELAKLRHLHPVISKILEYREVSKLLGTYIDALPELVDAGGFLHTTLHQTMTSTGRLSSSNPNLQNIPTRTEVGRQIRRAFVAREGYQLVSFDYSQIELRVAAAMSGDQKMRQAFLEGADIHTMTAMEVNNLKTAAEVTPEMRYAAKALNFGILYGMGPRAFSESAGIPYPDARKFMQEYFNDFPKIKEFMQRTLEDARRKGYVETMLGRRRYIPEINAPNWRLRADAERMAMNAPIQGTATGDIVKLAMIKIHEYLKRQATSDLPAQAGKLQAGHILMQVHDELLCEIKTSKVSKVSKEIKGFMEEVYDIGVPLVVDVKVGDNWGEMKKLES